MPTRISDRENVMSNSAKKTIDGESMKKITIWTLIYTVLCGFFAVSGAIADESRDIIMSAMRDEMARNMERLRLESMEDPFFISYTIYDVKTTEIVASLGSIIRSSSDRNRNHNVRLMVGDYELNDENFRSMGSSSRSSMVGNSGGLPLEDDYEGIRRALWTATDNTYKSAAELFELKKAALEQQTISEEAKLDDLSRATAEIHIEDAQWYDIDTTEWENTAKEISSVFADYPELYASYVRLFFYQGIMYMVNSEGSEVATPLTMALIQVNAYTQAEDGEPLNDHFSFYRKLPDELPDRKALISEAKSMAEWLSEFRTAPVFDDSYFGPVLFEGQAAVEFFSQRLFNGRNGLIASRDQLSGDSRGFSYRQDDTTLDDRMDRRILSRDLSINALNGLKSYNGLGLVGSYAIDAEGVKTPKQLTLVENGILKTLLSNRTPSRKVRYSNGHQRSAIGSGYWTTSAVGPGVISIESDSGKSREKVKEELLRLAREEGLDYAIIVRKLKPRNNGSQYYDPMVRLASTFGSRDGVTLNQALRVYRVSVEDGSEEAVRSADLKAVSLSALRHIAAVSEERIVKNTLTTTNWSSGIPASFIVPEQVLLEELEVKKVKRDFTPKLPIAASPLAEK